MSIRTDIGLIGLALGLALGMALPAHAARPDLSGIYLPSIPKAATAAPFTPPYLERYRESVLAQKEGRVIRPDGSRCDRGVDFSVLMTSGFPVEIIETPTMMLWLFEGTDAVRRIYMDGRPHPKKLPPSEMGHSVGRWEGDTLLIDTVGIRDALLSPFGESFGPRVHVVERVRADPVTRAIMIDLTITDPDALTALWSLRNAFTARPDLTMLQYDCMQNNDRYIFNDLGVIGVKGLEP